MHTIAGLICRPKPHLPSSDACGEIHQGWNCVHTLKYRGASPGSCDRGSEASATQRARTVDRTALRAFPEMFEGCMHFRKCATLPARGLPVDEKAALSKTPGRRQTPWGAAQNMGVMCHLWPQGVRYEKHQADPRLATRPPSEKRADHRRGGTRCCPCGR